MIPNAILRAAVLGVALAPWTTLSAQQPTQPFKKPPTFEEFEAEFKKILANPAYDVTELHNNENFYIGGLANAGRFDEALKLCQAILDRDKAGGRYGEMGHIYMVNRYAEICSQAGKHDKAIAIREEWLAWCAEEYGEKNSMTTEARFLLATTCTKAGKHERAIELYEKALALTTKPDHKFRTLGELLAAYRKAGNLDKEIATSEAILELSKTIYGKNVGVMTQRPRLDLAQAYARAGKKNEARKMAESILVESRSTNGPDHPTTLGLMPIVAETLIKMKDVDAGLALYKEALELQKKKNGADHADTLMAMNHLGWGYQLAGQYDKAIETYKAAYTTMKEKLGPTHANTLLVLTYLAAAYEEAKKPAEAEPLRREYLAGQIKLGGSAETPGATGALAQLGLNLLKQEKWDDAEKTLRECLELRRKKEPEAWTTFNTMSLVGAALFGQKKHKDAEPFLVEGFEGLKRRVAYIPEQGRFRYGEALERLIQLYDATDRKLKADDLRKELNDWKKQ